jgi:hypothetical protein
MVNSDVERPISAQRITDRAVQVLLRPVYSGHSDLDLRAILQLGGHHDHDTRSVTRAIDSATAWLEDCNGETGTNSM